MTTIKDYESLGKFISAFSKKKLNLLIVVSRGGLGKSRISEDNLIVQAPLIFTGHVTPLGMYKELLERNEEEKDFITIFDDVDTLMLNKTNVALLKQLCDTRENKIIKYVTTSPILKDIPSEFETQCKVLMLMNDVKTDDKNLNALLTRAHFINFDPPGSEIVRHIKTFAEDKEIVNFLEMYAPFTKKMNLRVYVRANELKQSKLDWKEEIINELKIDRRLFEVEKLLKKYKTDKEREDKFSESRSQFYRFKRLFIAKNPNFEKSIKHK